MHTSLTDPIVYDQLGHPSKEAKKKNHRIPQRKAEQPVKMSLLHPPSWLKVGSESGGHREATPGPTFNIISSVNNHEAVRCAASTDET